MGLRWLQVRADLGPDSSFACATLCRPCTHLSDEAMLKMVVHAFEHCCKVWSLRTTHVCHAALCKHTGTHTLGVCCSCTWISYVGAVAVGSHHDALESYQTAVSLAPACLIHRVELGRTLDRLGKKEQARRELEVSLPCHMRSTSIRCVCVFVSGVHQLHPSASPFCMPFCTSTATQGLRQNRNHAFAALQARHSFEHAARLC